MKLFLLSLLALAVIASIVMDHVSAQESAQLGANVDSDGDGFSDAQERAWITNPNDATSFPLKDTQPAAQWISEPPKGTEVSDSSENEITAYLEGTSLPQWDAVEQALVFDGKQNQLRVPNSDEVSPTTSFTLTAWIRVPVGSEGLIVGKWPNEGLQGSYALALNSGRLALALSLDGEYRPLFGQRIVADGEWHFVAATFDGYRIAVLVDGILDVQAHIDGRIDAVDLPLLLGLMEGKLSDVRVYSQALRQDELLLLYELSTEPLGEKEAKRPRMSKDEGIQAGIEPSTISPAQRIRLRGTVRMVRTEEAQ